MEVQEAREPEADLCILDLCMTRPTKHNHPQRRHMNRNYTRYTQIFARHPEYQWCQSQLTKPLIRPMQPRPLGL